MIDSPSSASKPSWSLKVRFSMQKDKMQMMLFMSDMILKCRHQGDLDLYIKFCQCDKDSKGCIMDVRMYSIEEMTVQNYLEQHNEVSSYIFEPKIAPIQSKLINTIDAIAIICIIVYIIEMYIY